MIGKFEFVIENVTHAETERVRSIIATMLESGVFNIKHGYANIYFSPDGALQSIEVHLYKYKKKKDTKKRIK